MKTLTVSQVCKCCENLKFVKIYRACGSSVTMNAKAPLLSKKRYYRHGNMNTDVFKIKEVDINTYISNKASFL